MFRGGQPNPYDDIVVKATDENQTSENWEIILNLCDKVVDEGEQGARSVIAAVLKRLVHRNPNVQLYALAVVEALSKNCGIEVHREIASRSFTQGLERLVTDRTAHDKVKRKALSLIAMWTEDFEKDPSLSIMEECYTSLKQKNFKFDAPTEPPPPQVDDEIRRREEEELQRVLEMSMHDKGGRQQWAGYSAAAASNSNGAGASGSTASVHRTAAAPAAAAPAPAPAPAPSYAPAAIPAPAPAPVAASSYRTPSPAAAAVPTSPTSPAQAGVTRVRALHTFEPTEPGELAFEKGDIIKVVDRNYKDWWRGQLRGRTGIFPVNYVEPLPDPTPAELAREAEQEAAVFAQAANIDKLLTMLRSFDPAKDNLADNEEIQELYRQSMSLRPKIVKLIDKYSQKRADLVFMNESFVKARGIFERMMEDSLARHTGLYGGRQPAGPQRPQQGPAPYAWNPALYDQAGYPGVPYNAGTPGAYGPPPQQPQQQQTPGAYGPAPAGYGPSPAPPTAAPYQAPEGQQYPPQPYPAAYGQQGAPQQPAGPHQPAGPDPNAPQYGQPTPYGQPQPYSPAPQQQPHQHAQQHVPGQPAPQQQQQQQHVPGQPGPQQHQHVPGQDPHAQQQQQQYPGYGQQQPVQQQQQQQQQQQPAQQPAATPAPAPAQAGPIQPQADGRYIFDPQGTYADPNVQAWAQYYAQGGPDPAGSVYFVSVPGVTDGAAAAAPPQAQAQPQEQQQQQQPLQSAPEPDPAAGAPPAQFAAAAAPPNGSGHAPELPPITATGSFDFQPPAAAAAVGSPVQAGFPTYAPEGIPLATSPPPVQQHQHQPGPGYVQQMSHQFGGMALHEPPQGPQPAPA